MSEVLPSSLQDKALSQICEMLVIKVYYVLNCERGSATFLVRQKHCRRFCGMLVIKVYCVLNCERGFAKFFVRQKHCRRFVKCLLSKFVVS